MVASSARPWLFAGASGFFVLVGGLALARVFSGEIILDAVVINLGPLSIRWYGLIIASAVALGFFWTLQRAARRGIESSQIETVLWPSIVGGLIGARLLYVVQNLEFYVRTPFTILSVTDGGLSVHGMLLGGLLTAGVVARQLKVSFWAIADAAVPAILLGMILGRFGNLFNYELLGYPTDVAWKMFVPEQFRPLGLEASAFFHPIFLYDAFLNSFVLLGLLLFERRAKFTGELALWFLLGISATRFVVEFWRLNVPASVGLSTAQLTSLILGVVILCVLLLARRGRIKEFRSIDEFSPRVPSRFRS